LSGVSGNDYAQWLEKFKGTERVKAFNLNTQVKITIEADLVKEMTQNVVACLESKDPEFGQEWIILTAHYDHLGEIVVPEGEDGIYNGADDNASGTAAIIKVARKLAGLKDLKRSVMTVFCCGEENGLLGSAYFTSHSLVPLQKIVLNINADMVGRSSGTVNCRYTGCNEIYQRSQLVAADHSIKVMPDPFPTWRLLYFIDSYNFARFSIPFIEFMTDFHSDYHQPADEVQLINFIQLKKITEVIYDLTLYYANGGQRPTFSRPSWFLTSKL